MSDSQPSNKKRSALTASIDTPDKEPANKKTKLATALETRLTELKQVLHPHRLPPTWEDYDPGHFMNGMIRLRARVNDLTLKTVESYIKTGLKVDLNALDIQEEKLKKPIEPKLAQTTREQMNDYVQRVRGCLNALVDQANVKPSPNDFADSEQWRVYQDRDDAILCLRPAEKRGLPIPLMYKAFCSFTSHFHEPILDEHTPEYLSMADKLCQVMPSAFDSEDTRRDAFEKIFASLDKDLIPSIGFTLSAKEFGARPNLARTINCEGDHLVLLLEEFKMESTGDIYMQICRSYEVLCGEAKNERLLKFGNPVFLLCVLGPYLMVCGAIKRENAHVEPLTPLLPMFPEFGIEGRTVQIAHCLRALKKGLDALREFWQEVGIIGDTNKKTTIPTPYLVSACPDNGLLRFDDWQGAFKSPMHHGSNRDKPPCFLAKLYKADSERQVEVVVKFVYNYTGTYSATVHEYLYRHKLAPLLYVAKSLHRGLDMVVMEHLSFEKGLGGWVELDKFEGKLGTEVDAVRKKLAQVVELLRKQGMVHADLRPKNIMVMVDGNDNMMVGEHGIILRVIDFDWAGTVGNAFYPPFLNPKVPWPTGAKAYQKVGESDDEILFNNWWDAFVKG